MSDLEAPMGNAEMRLSFANLEGEVAEVKGIAIDTHEQAKKTNGRVTALEKWQYGSLVGLSILTPIVGWVTVDYLNHRDQTASTEQIQAAVASGIQEALQEYKTTQ